MGEIISFYSYKGGVGRSMALANVAALLAQRGHRVLAVDFDLDAPGLHRYFLRDDTPLGAGRRTPAAGQRGVIEMFQESRTRLAEAEARGAGGPSPSIASIVRRLLDAPDYGYEVRIVDPLGDAPTSLRLLPAGRFDKEYSDRVQGFPWTELFEVHGELFEELVTQWRERFDYVLVDSRTGVTDIGSISTVILPDKLVLAFTPNEQSLHGAIEVGRRAALLKREAGAGAALPLFPLISRVDEGEEILRRTWMREAARRFGELFRDLNEPEGIDLVAYFEAVHIPHSSYYAYGERIAVEEDRPGAFGSVAAGYARFADCLEGARLSGWQDRLREPLHSRGRTVALVASFEAPIEPPESFQADRVVRIPQEPLPAAIGTLREVPVRQAAWDLALAEIDQGVLRAVRSGRGEIHVFATLSYPAAAYLGRRLDDLARARPVILHQLDPSGLWTRFSAPEERAAPPPPGYYGALQEVHHAPGASAALLVLEGVRPTADRLLHDLAGAQSGGAAIYRLRPREMRALAPREAPGAVDAVRKALIHVQLHHPAAVLHVVSTAPVALLIELGRLVTPTVYRSVVVHQYDPQAGSYVPCVDILARRVLSE